MDKKEQILKLYYEEDRKLTYIADIIQVSNAYVSKVIKTDSRYKEKKLQQKENAKKRKREYTNLKMKQIREKKIQENAFIKQQHIDASKELSGGKVISNRAFRNWNSSIYKYDEKIKAYKLKKGMVISSDVPKKINWRNF